MSLSQQIAANLPYLRRFARALTGSQAAGDSAVRRSLEFALTDNTVKQSLAGGRVPLYRLFLQVLAKESGASPTAGSVASGMEAAAQGRLGGIAPVQRQALLLTTLEEFTAAEAAKVMDLSVSEVDALISQSVSEIASDQSTRVLIIEDEPMILVQLEDLVIGQGHEVCGTATTHKEAIKAANAEKPGLVLADIQLADGSSGIEAVEEILTQIDVPVIFITGFPERLLTGEGSEPTYLVTKPFKEETVIATISQALFFNPAEQGSA